MSIRCYFCGADTEQRAVTVDERWDGRLVVIEGVPAEVCPQCGEVYYGPESVRRLYELQRSQPADGSTLDVLVFTFARKGEDQTIGIGGTSVLTSRS